MSVLYSDPSSLGHGVFGRLRFRDDRHVLWRGRMLCKPLSFCHHFRRADISFSKVSVRARFWRAADRICREGPQQQTSAALCQESLHSTLQGCSDFSCVILLRIFLGTWDSLSLFLFHHDHQLYSSPGWAEILISFYPKV